MNFFLLLSSSCDRLTADCRLYSIGSGTTTDNLQKDFCSKSSVAGWPEREREWIGERVLSFLLEWISPLSPSHWIRVGCMLVNIPFSIHMAAHRLGLLAHHSKCLIRAHLSCYQPPKQSSGSIAIIYLGNLDIIHFLLVVSTHFHGSYAQWFRYLGNNRF